MDHIIGDLNIWVSMGAFKYVYVNPSQPFFPSEKIENELAHTCPHLLNLSQLVQKKPPIPQVFTFDFHKNITS